MRVDEEEDSLVRMLMLMKNRNRQCRRLGAVEAEDPGARSSCAFVGDSANPSF